MTRVPTSNYGASASTQFNWATDDSDQFNRELDLYRLSQALELHDHSSTRGLAVTRMADNSIDEVMYKPLSVSTRALANLSVTAAKIAAGTITDDKLAVAKMEKAGGIMTGNLQVMPTGAPTTGYYFMGSGSSSIGYDGTSMVLNNAGGGFVIIVTDTKVYRGFAPTTGYTFYGTGGQYIGFDGTNLVASGQVLRSSANTVDAPLGGMVTFKTLAELTAAGPRWARETALNGRLILGAGSAGGIPEVFLESTAYGSSWAPLTIMGYSITRGGLAVGGISTSATASPPFLAAASAANNPTGATNVDVGGHTHPVTGGALTGDPAQVNAGAPFYSPMFAVIWGRRIS